MNPLTPIEGILTSVLEWLHQTGEPAVGLGRRRADADRADHPRPAHGPADPLDAADAGAPAGDEGDPGQAQGRPRAHEPGADGLLQGEQDQPGGVLPADPGADPDLLRALLRAQGLRGGDLPEVSRDRPRLARDRPEHHRPGQLALVGLPAAGDLRDQPDGFDAADVEHDGPDAADAAADPAARLPLRRPELPGRPRPLLGDDEPVDRRPGVDHAPAGAQAEAAREAVLAYAAEELAIQSDGEKPAEPAAEAASSRKPAQSSSRARSSGRSGPER